MAEQPKERLDRINELAKKDRSVGLTPEEKIERQKLREAYLKDFRAGLRDQIEHTQVFDKKGHEITSKKSTRTRLARRLVFSTSKRFSTMRNET